MTGLLKGECAVKKSLILLLFLMGTTVSAWCQTTFTPTTVGWYRVISSIGVSSVGGILRMYAPYTNGTFTDNEIQFNETGYAAGGSIQETRFSSFGGSMVSQARLSGDGEANIYLDIYVSTVGGPLTLYFDGPNINGVVDSPVVGAVAGSYTLPTLTLAQGLSTTSNLNAIGTLNVSGSGNSSILGNLGIGTTSPGAMLEVNGNVKLTSGSGASITFADGSVQSSAPPASLTSNGGNVGIGTTNPFGVLHIQGSTGQSSWVYDTGNAQGSNPLTYFTSGTAFGWNQSDGGGESDLVFGTGAGANPGLQISEWDGTTYQTDLFVKKGGNVGIGTLSPGAKLEVDGNIKLTPGSGASITFADGTVQTTAYAGTSCPIAELVMPDKTIVAQGGDYAESVDVNGDRASYEPGDVMVIDPANPEHFLKSSKPYSTLVAGIYSTKPGYVGRRQPGDPKMAKTEIPMAMIGIVPTKVTTENGPINVGDLLVTSSTTGYAMKGTKRKALSGAIVGKALTKLDSGTGTIEVLVSLQ